MFDEWVARGVCAAVGFALGWVSFGIRVNHHQLKAIAERNRRIAQAQARHDEYLRDKAKRRSEGLPEW